ncbi:hypothetical protein N8731_01510 [Pelagibacteraceae bacterium]|jgi:uncharacterized protein YjcR|nr:hypothetical protein [Pelagibacteraceae bacterium]MDC1148169.1 hypothetical protein [Pelagibacteraceae bacterium]|tara:strand:- start:1576 stop:1773 length:198 start_codon:yes stop_codon:yes gene_type:complete
MSYEDFIEALESLYMTVEDAAEKLGLEVDEIKSWEELDDDIPLEAQELIEVEKENRANTSSEEQD